MMATSQRAFVKRLRRVYGVTTLTRSDWGSRRGATYAWRLIFRKAQVPADTVVQHITVTPDTGKFLPSFRENMRLLEQIGFDRFGTGVSYNACVDDQGLAGMGMPLRAAGAHTLNDKGVPGYSFNQNYVARAIAWIGLEGETPTEACVDTITKIIACLMDCGHVTEDPDYDPHSKFAFKSCPLDSMKVQMPSILRNAKRLHETNKNVKTPRRR